MDILLAILFIIAVAFLAISAVSGTMKLFRINNDDIQFGAIFVVGCLILLIL